MKPDLVVYSKDKKIQLIIEVKKKSDPTSEWAAKTRHNLITHQVIQPSPFFLLISPKRSYLWKNPSAPQAIPPAYEADTVEFLSQYTTLAGLNLEEISEYSLEILVRSWLNDLTRPDATRKMNGTRFDWVYESGLYEAINNGWVMAEVAP